MRARLLAPPSPLPSPSLWSFSLFKSVSMSKSCWRKDSSEMDQTLQGSRSGQAPRTVVKGGEAGVFREGVHHLRPQRPGSALNTTRESGH